MGAKAAGFHGAACCAADSDAAEAAIMFFRVAAEGTMLFQAVLDTGCAAAYLFIFRRGLFGLKKE